MTRSDDYTTRRASYDLRKLRGKDRGYENLGIGVQTLFLHVGIAPRPASARQHCVDRETHPASRP
jgi:hypothetical protein